jgi:hypothetical protein
MMARTIAASGAWVSMARRNERSIFTLSMGSSRR